MPDPSARYRSKPGLASFPAAALTSAALTLAACTPAQSQLPKITLKIDPPAHTQSMGELTSDALDEAASIINASPIARASRPAEPEPNPTDDPTNEPSDDASTDPAEDPAADDTEAQPSLPQSFTAAITTRPPAEDTLAVRVVLTLANSATGERSTDPLELPLTEDLTQPEPLGRLLAAHILNRAVPPTVISVRSGIVLIDAGAPQGLGAGDRLDVTTPPRKALNLETGEFETRPGRTLATIELVRVRGTFSEAKTVEGIADDLPVGARCTLVVEQLAGR